MRPREKDVDCRYGFEPEDRHAIRLLKLLGPRAFQALQTEFGGMRVWVPKPGARFPCGACRTREACARRWRQEGQTPAKIARHLGVSVKTVYRLLDNRGAIKSAQAGAS
ncbi:MAG: helix-turn-helix domain-containing protein [Elusimicrobia bacterium]|nr:helix-turn-helix domain-containing protein [Elusimicrobiota bacterium]